MGCDVFEYVATMPAAIKEADHKVRGARSTNPASLGSVLQSMHLCCADFLSVFGSHASPFHV
jgi:hypothetical protein